MEKLDFTNVKKVLLVGAGGKTGFWYARLLISNDIEVYAYDKNEAVVYSGELLDNSKFFSVNSAEFDDQSILDKVDSVTLSPGVPLMQKIFSVAQEKNKFVFSELEYCYSKLSDRRWICVTGTDGKSTTVALVEHGLNAFGKHAISCGNFGLPFSRIALEQNEYAKYEFLVAELSSYQLELSRNLQCDVGLYLNLAPDHLNRYSDLEEYGRVKFNIAFSVKNNGLLIVNKNLLPDATGLWRKNHPLKEISKSVSIISVDNSCLTSENFRVTENQITNLKNKEKVIDLEKINIYGEHNYSNVLFTLETLNWFHCNDVVILNKALSTFQSLPHRYEKIVLKNDQNMYINDSKATTTQAAAIAIKNSKSPLFLFLGGRSKGEDYNPVASIIQNKQAFVFLYGENRFELQEVFQKNNVQMVNVEETLDMVFQKAVEFQKNRQIPEATYLLSPASTSWDQYSSFEERGNHFRKLVESIKII